ncbi:MAG: hypothetical protein CM1200mP2_13340 [Planctomycetaceae bacterium]|nr:MAG: hypothetical protein CM1200mP2_13340 [Planctomycetaceae bacterium]
MSLGGSAPTEGNPRQPRQQSLRRSRETTDDATIPNRPGPSLLDPRRHLAVTGAFAFKETPARLNRAMVDPPLPSKCRKNGPFG